jgi:hypothetical protein
MPARTLLQFEPVLGDQGLSEPAWVAADHKFAFTITRERNVFVARANRLDGTNQCRISRRFKDVRGCCSVVLDLHPRVPPPGRLPRGWSAPPIETDVRVSVW